MEASLGIDIAKAKFAVALLTGDRKVRHKSCVNTPAGFADLAAWLQRQHVRTVHACLEATGTYGDALATWLYDAGHVVSVVNPAIIHAYARTQLARSKTDRLDAELIARFTATQRPPAWTPPAREIRQLQALVRRLDALQGMRTQELNRLEAGVSVGDVRASIEAVLAHLDVQIAHVKQLIRDHLDRHPGLRAQRALLTTIPGIGETTGSTPPGSHRWLSSARPCANSFISPTGYSNRERPTNRRAPTLDSQHGISVCRDQRRRHRCRP